MTAYDDISPHLTAIAARAAGADEEVEGLKASSAALVTDLTRRNLTIDEQRTTIETLQARIAELEGAVTPPPPPPVDLIPWQPPALVNPIALTLKDNFGTLTLGKGDYILQLPADRPVKNARGLHVVGGNNIKIVGGAVDIGDGYTTTGTGPGVPADKVVRRAWYFQNQTGTVWLEGVAFHSSTKGNLSEGLNISAPEAKVRIVNVDLRSDLIGSKDFNHADGLQSWNGPRSLKVCGFHCRSNYQGMFLNPHDLGSGPVDEDWELRDVWIEGLPGAKYGLWLVSPPAKVKTSRVHVTGGLGPWDAANDWPAVLRTAPAEPYGWDKAGVGYVSPGYAAA